MKLPQLSLRELFLLVVIAAMGCGWWVSWQRAAQEQQRLASELAALRRARTLDLEMRKNSGFAVPYVPQELRQTPEEFIAALREIKDWYKFADDTADPFAMSPAAEQAIPALLDLLADSDKEVRTRAACTLGKIKRQPERVVPALIPVLEDREPNVQWHAAFALRQFGPEAKAALPALWRRVSEGLPAVAIDCADVIRAIDSSADIESSIIPYLQSDAADQRVRAAIVLRKHGAVAAKQALVAAFERETEESLKDSIALSIEAIDARLNKDESQEGEVTE